MCRISHIWGTEGWLYLAVGLDLFSQEEVISWTINKRIDSNLVIEALRMALLRQCYIHI